MIPQLLIQPKAEQDIDEHLDYLAEESGLETAVRFFDVLEHAFENLLSMQEMGPARTYRNLDLKGLRIWPMTRLPKYLIFYLPFDNGIKIIRVLYGTRDIETALEE